MRYILLICFLSTLSCSQDRTKEEADKPAEQQKEVAQKDSVITLEIHAKPGDQFFFGYTDPLFNFNMMETPEKLKVDSVFSETIISHKPVLLKDIHYKAQHYIYLLPGEKYHITQDSMISHFELAGNPKRTYELNAMRELKKHARKQKRLSEWNFKDQARYQRFTRMDFKSRDSVLKSEYDDNVRFLNTYASKNDFSEEQKKILNRNLFYQYKNAHYFFNKRTPQNVQKYLAENQALYKELQPVMHCDTCFEDPEFSYLTQSFAKNYVADPEKVGSEKAYSAYSSTFNGKTRDYLLYNLIKFGGMFNATKPNPKLAGQFENDAQDSLLKGYIKEIYSFLDAKKSATGQLVNAAGETTSWAKLLETHRNKVVYVDFWASWCGPCRAEVPASKLLKDRFAGKDVVFVNISIDENNAAWKKASAKDGIDTGENYILIQPEKSDLKKQYQINSIPRYFLVDKAGKVVNSNAARPSDEEIVTDINKLL